MPRPLLRPNRFTLLLSDAESEMLDKLAARDEVTASDVVRGLIRREARRVLKPRARTR